MRGLVLFAACLLGLGCGSDYDLVLEGGSVLDGSGSPAIRADVGIKDGRIVEIGNLEEASASHRVDVAGRVVAPGFIDVHSHAGLALETEALRHGEPLLRQGITTIVANPDGGGRTDIAVQMADLEASGPGVNVALLVPHGSVRRQVVGMDDREASQAELDSMLALTQAGKDAGAFGLSSGLFYTPGSFAPLDEVVEMAALFENEGVYISHIRDESDYSIGLMAAVEEVIEVAERASVTGVVTHIKALGPNVWGLSDRVVARIEEARADGVDIWADQYPYEASATGLNALVSRPLLAGGLDSLRVRFDRDPEAIRADVVNNLARRGGSDRIQFRRFRPDPSIEGQTLDVLAADRGLHPVDQAIELILQGGASIVSHNMQASDVETFMRQPWVMTSSDGSLVPLGEGVPHPRNYGAFPRKIAEYVRARNTLPLEAAIRSMTGLPADVMRFSDRGYIRRGQVADLVVFDPDRIQDKAIFTDPHQLSEGVEHVLIGGAFAVERGTLSESRHGSVLRRQ